MTLPLIHGHDLNDWLTAWAAERIPTVGAAGFGPAYAVGVARGDQLAAVVVYSDFQPEYGTVQMSIAAETPRWATRQIVGALFGFAFHGLGRPLHLAWAATRHDNARAVKLLRGIGMKPESVLRHRFGWKQHASVYSLTVGEWRARYGKESA